MKTRLCYEGNVGVCVAGKDCCCSNHLGKGVHDVVVYNMIRVSSLVHTGVRDGYVRMEIWDKKGGIKANWLGWVKERTHWPCVVWGLLLH